MIWNEDRNVLWLYRKNRPCCKLGNAQKADNVPFEQVKDIPCSHVPDIVRLGKRNFYGDTESRSLLHA